VRTRPVDIAWLLVIAVCAVVVVGTLVSLTREFVFVYLLGLMLPAIVAAGAWKRTKWGAPPGGLREHQETRRISGS